MTIKSLFLALLIAALGGSLCAQTPNGAYSSPASGSSSSGATGVPKNVVDPTNTIYAGGAKANGHMTFIPTITNGSNIITAADGNFTSTDSQGRAIARVGQTIFCSTATTDLSMETSVIITFGGLAETTISQIDSATQFRTVGNSNTSTTASGLCVWGDLDTPVAATTPTTANDPILAAWTVAAQNCIPFNVPTGVSLWEHGEINTFPVTGGCGNQNSLTNIRQGFRVYGQGMNASIIVMTPNFKSTDCTGPNGTANGCLLSVPNPIYSDFQVFGGGNSAPGAGFNGKNLWLVPGISPGVNFTLTNLLFSGFGANQSVPGTGPTGFNVGNNVTNGVSGGQMTNVQIETFGATACKFDSPGSGGGTSIMNAVHLWCNATQFNLYVHNGVLASLDGLYGWAFGAFSQVAPNFTGNSVVVDNGATMKSDQDGCYGNTSSGGGMCFYAIGSPTEIDINQAVIVVGTAGQGAISVNNGATVTMGGAFLSAPFAIFMGQSGACGSACKFLSRGGNNMTTSNTGYTSATGAVVMIAPTDTLTGFASTLLPTCAMTTGGGAGPACALVAGSTNEKGTIRMTPGTAPGASGTTTLTFVSTFNGATTTTPSCTFNYANTGTGAWSLTTTTPIVMTTRSSTVPVFNWNQTGALTAASTYDIDYVCQPR